MTRLLPLCVVAIATLLATPSAPAQSKKAREQLRAEAAVEKARIRELMEERDFDPVLARCQARGERELKRHRIYTAFRWSEAPETVESTKPLAKFTPRHPIDVEVILKLAGELRRKKDDAWVDGELWCGIEGEDVRATDVFGPGERR